MAEIITKSRILGPDGQPIEKRQLTEEIAEAQMTGVRSVWSHSSVADFLNPVRLADTLERARLGDHHDFLTLAEEMEERDLHYGGVLGTRKRALSGIKPVVEAASDDARDQEIAQAVRDQITSRPDFGNLVDDCLDALGKGYSAIEIIWETSARQWNPLEFKWRDPHFFNLCQANGHDLKLITDDNPFGDPLAPYKFIVHRPRLKAGLPIRGALGRLVAVAYMCKGVALSDWMTFSELFGMPVRVGKYGKNATPAEKATLRAAVASLGSDAAAIMPESMNIEFVEAAKASGGEEVFERLCNFLDKQVSKGVVGQTMTSDDGSSQSQATVHNEVRGDILGADKTQLENTVNQDLTIPFVDFNYGPQKRYPRITFPIVEPEDVVALTGAIKELVPLGLKVSQKTVRDKFGLPEPKDDDDILHVPTATTPVEEPAQVALNSEQPASISEEDSFTESLEGWEEQMAPIIDPVQRLANESETEEEFIAGLPGLLDQMDDVTLVKQLAVSFFKARGEGEGT